MDILSSTSGHSKTIAPISPTPQNTTLKNDLIDHPVYASEANNRLSQYDNLIYAVFFMITVTGCLLLGKLISVIARDAV